jgi:F0F1-type ATP synthase assembly protein I
MKEEKPNAPQTRNELIAFAFDVGGAIAIPLVLFAFGGRMLDKAQGTSPLFLIIGLLLSLISTGIIIWKKVKNFL